MVRIPRIANFLPIISCLLFSISAHATVIQILHTNDLHAALSTAGAPKAGDDEYGGWAQVKAKMDELTAQAKEHGMETLRVDAGDFTEGTMDYFPDFGTHILKTFQHMGYDVATMGNHDWLMGARNMNIAYGEAPFPFPVLSANISLKRNLPNLIRQIIPTAQIIKSGIKIGIVGLSTDEAMYKWITAVNSRKNEFKINGYSDSSYEDQDADGNPITVTEAGVANSNIDWLKRRNDVVIALTHIGVAEDRLLAESSHHLDLIIGGHSHTVLDSLNLAKNQDGREIPIVQTGVNGKYVGKILLEVLPGKNPQVLSYELVPVLNNGPKDPVVSQDIAEADAALQKLYGVGLSQVVGNSEVRLVSGDNGPTAFAKFAVDAFRNSTGTDFAVDIGAFHGNTPQAAGQITRLGLRQMYPRKLEVAQNEGLYLYEATLPGLLVTIGVKYALRFGFYLSTSGIDYDIAKLSDSEFAALKAKYVGTADYASVTPYYPMNIKINGAPIRALHWYSVGAPEFLVRGLFGLTSLAHLVVHGAHPTTHTIWESLETYLAKIGTIKRVSPDESKFNTRLVSNTYQKRFAGGHDREQVEGGEAVELPYVNDAGSFRSVLKNSFDEILSDPEGRTLNPENETETMDQN
jgi:2',3'-cyclic-nucleotide 2'-phosphodiesterase (5'-nucleotidase family)